MKGVSGQDVLVCWIVAVAFVAIIAAGPWGEAAMVDDLELSMRRAAHSSELARDRYAGRSDLSDLEVCDPEDRTDRPLISASREIEKVDDTTLNC